MKLFHLLVAGLILLAFSWSVCQAQSTCTQCIDGSCGATNLLGCLSGGPLCNRTTNCCQCVENKCQYSTDCKWKACSVGETASCILKRVGSECVCLSYNYCTANGTQFCPADKFPRNSASTYDRNCRVGPGLLDPNYAEGREQRGFARLCRGDRYQEECNCVPAEKVKCRSWVDCHQRLTQVVQSDCPSTSLDCINRTCACPQRCESRTECACQYEDRRSCGPSGYCNCVNWCRTDQGCTERRHCASGTISRCVTGYGRCTPCRLECNSDLDCASLNCTGNTQYKKCIQDVCSCVQCKADSDCASLSCPANKPYKQCYGNTCTCVECLETYQCPDCTGFSKKLCKQIGDPKNTCTCLNPYGCEKNADCHNNNSYDCGLFSLAPPCCWRRCDLSMVCQCRSSSDALLGCEGGRNGFEARANC
ncbi:tenascin-like isoform X1 [Folsomia candida]|uniref:tenascin-like isoform X1 n=1 Tax=Folsomia candida TaxID=158441 RepID=UPI001604F22F|nr:tenascin-like isoform X1 [Folsomia candida]